MSPFLHHAYGLRIESVIDIPEIPRCSFTSGGDSDVKIEIGPVPRRLEPVAYEQHDPTERGENYLIISDERVLLHVDGTGRYLVEGGSRITIDPEPDAGPHELRVFLLGTCLGALLHQRGAFVLHASGIASESGAVLFAGRSGAGKSTLLAEFLTRGYSMLVDDVCAITSDGRGLTVEPSYPRTRIWADTAAEMEIDTTGLQRTLSEMEKFERQLPEQFSPDPLPLRVIYDLAGPAEEELVFDRLSPLEALPTLIAHTYRKMMLDALGTRRHHFEMASELARTVPIIRLTRPAVGFHAGEMADRIIADLGLTSPP